MQRNKWADRKFQAALLCLAAISTAQGVQRLSHATPAFVPESDLQPVPSQVQALPMNLSHKESRVYRFRIIRPDNPQTEIKVSVASWQKLPNGATGTASVSTRIGRFAADETDKELTISIDPTSIRSTSTPEQFLDGDAHGQFYVSETINACLNYTDSGDFKSLRLDNLANPFVSAAVQYPKPGPAVSLPTLSVRRNDAVTMEEDSLANPVQPVHTAKVMTATDKQGDVVAALAIKLETLAPKN